MIGEATLCSECYDDYNCAVLIAVIPQSRCERCGEIRLGYRTVVCENETGAAEAFAERAVSGNS